MRSIQLFTALAVAATPFCAELAAQTPEPASLTVNADGDGAYVSLGEEARTVEVTDPMGSSLWDLGFLGTSLIVNGGETGTAGVTVHCVCGNAQATNDEVMRMTPDTELADFEAVTAADIPEDASSWHPITFVAAPWYRYNIAQQHMIWPTYNVYLVKRGEDVYKMQITSYYGLDGTPRQITFRYSALAQ